MSELGLLDIVENPKKDIVDGPFGSNMKSSDYREAGVPVIKLQNIKVNYFLEKNISFVTQKKASELARHSYQAGDIIITKLGDPLGVACIMPESFPKGIIVADLIRLRPDPAKVDTKFLCYQLNSPLIMNQFKELTKGTTRPRVNLTLVRQIKVWIPDADKQRKVTEKIDDLFSDIHSGDELLRKSKENLELFKQSILNSAIRGKLATQDKNYESASALLEKIIAEKENHIKTGKIKKEKLLSPIDPYELPFDLPDRWRWVRLRDLSTIITKGSSPNWQGINYVDKGSGILFITSKNVQKFWINFSNAEYVEERFNEIEPRSILKSGDVLTNIVGASIGRTAIFNQDLVANINQAVCIIRPVMKFMGPWIELILNSTYGLSLMNDNQVEMARANLGMGQIEKFLIPIPPESLLVNLVDKVKDIFKSTDLLIDKINKKQSQNVLLKQSILKKAFEGKLI